MLKEDQNVMLSDARGKMFQDNFHKNTALKLSKEGF
jgi:hypothetical protein